MTLETKTTTQLIPNPKGLGSWYWFRKNKDEKWSPVFVNAATKSWPPCINDVHSTAVKDLSGEWHSEILYPE
jgi:hypothetical protein